MEISRTRIPAKEAQQSKLVNWELPSIKDGTIIEVERSGDRQPSESIEDIDAEARPLTAEELAEISAAAQQEGYEAGYQKGLKAGEEKAYQETRGLIEKQTQLRFQQLANIAAVLANGVNEQDRDVEKVLIQLVVTISEAVIRRSLSKEITSLLPKIVEEALDQLPQGAANIAIYLCPEDCKLMQHYAVQSGAFPPDWEFLPDADMQAGDVQIVTKESIVDFDCETRARQVFEQVFAGALDPDFEPMKAQDTAAASPAATTDMSPSDTPTPKSD